MIHKQAKMFGVPVWKNLGGPLRPHECCSHPIMDIIRPLWHTVVLRTMTWWQLNLIVSYILILKSKVSLEKLCLKKEIIITIWSLCIEKSWDEAYAVMYVIAILFFIIQAFLQPTFLIWNVKFPSHCRFHFIYTFTPISVHLHVHTEHKYSMLSACIICLCK